MANLEKDFDIARKIATLVDKEGGTTYFVGGFVRDFLLGNDNKDIDIEVHGISSEVLENILDSIGERMTIGQSFGIYGIKGCAVDIAMPRKEKVIGTGHKDFDIFVDPFIGTRGAAIRRDFTINAMMQNVLTGEIVDCFGGQEDLKNRVIRHVNDESFVEDPLRVLRAAQFAARFGFEIADETIALCSGMNLTNLAKERIYAELEKALLKSDKPSVFFEQLRKMDKLDTWFKELADLIGVEQNPKHHAEGDVWVHTLMVLDEAVKYRDKVANPMAFMLSAVTHDFGKAVSSEIVKGEIHAYGHEVAGIPLAETFLRRITNEEAVIKYVLNLTKLHMKPNVLAGVNASIKSSNRMFDEAIDPLALVYIAIADGLGRSAPREYVSYDDYLFGRLETYNEYMLRPFVTGKDLIEAGLKPGVEFNEYLSLAHKLRLAGIDKKSALLQVLAMARKADRKKSSKKEKP